MELLFCFAQQATEKSYGFVKAAAAPGTFEVCGADAEGKIEIKEYTLTNSNNVSVSIISWGAVCPLIFCLEKSSFCRQGWVGDETLSLGAVCRGSSAAISDMFSL